MKNNTDRGQSYFPGEYRRHTIESSIYHQASDTVHLMFTIGIQIQNRDTSIMVPGFPIILHLINLQIFTTLLPVIARALIAAFKGDSTDVSSAYTSATTSEGIFPVTQLDQSAEIIAGTFNVTLTKYQQKRDNHNKRQIQDALC